MSSPILVIDDSLTIRKLLELSLTGSGYAVQVAANAADGLSLARRLRPRLILLDHILPDRKGTEVCTELAADPSTASIPVIVMSAKGDDIRPLFRDRPSVVACVGKPFAPAAIIHLVAETLGGVKTPPPAEQRSDPPTSTFRPQDAATASAAQAIFSAMRERLALIPSWSGEAVGQAPATFFARRLITPETVSRILEGVAPLITQQPAAVVQADSLLSGSTAVIDLPALMRLLRDLGRTGILELGHPPGMMELLCERGDVILALPAGEAGIQAAAAAGLDAPPPAGNGVPGLVAAAAGRADSAEILHRIGMSALLAIGASGPQTFRWRQVPAHADLVLQHGRAITPEQLALERLRLVDDWTQIEAEVASLDQVCIRAPDLATRLLPLSLSAIERQVLTEINGRRSVRAVVDRCRLSTFEIFHVIYRLIQARLVLARTAPKPAIPPSSPVLCAGAESRLTDPLRAILATRGLQPSAAVRDASGVAQAIAAGDGRAVILDVETCDAAGVARELRSALGTSAVLIIAVTDRDTDPAMLAEAGCDSILAAPVHAHDLTHLLGI